MDTTNIEDSSCEVKPEIKIEVTDTADHGQVENSHNGGGFHRLEKRTEVGSTEYITKVLSSGKKLVFMKKEPDSLSDPICAVKSEYPESDHCRNRQSYYRLDDVDQDMHTSGLLSEQKVRKPALINGKVAGENSGGTCYQQDVRLDRPQISTIVSWNGYRSGIPDPKFSSAQRTVTYTDRKPFKCDYCGKAYHLQRHLIRHTLQHTSEKTQYNCNFCGKAFAGELALRRHTATHTGESLFTCNYCGKEFSRKRGLDRHRFRQACTAW